MCIVFSICLFSTQAVRFVLNFEECFHQIVDYDGDHVQLSFVVTQAQNTWNHYHHIHGIDLKFGKSHKSPFKKKGYMHEDYLELVHRDKAIKHITLVLKKIHKSHLAKVIYKISTLEEAIYSVRFEQHWLYAQTKQQAIVNDNISKRVVQRAFLEVMALVSISALQVYLIRRLFKTKLGYSRV
ncbi:hypothetical protein KP509_33G030800 [Ceratopteris richardii]|uniref:GOLD domain-containing protein n=1 Tax=Ceratopteris richardii TaxID=49495 RepID=A0A8T2QNG0_CERRI|nr:hypothetical protein KP509_33G030800 [Ceratopteris richardii]